MREGDQGTWYKGTANAIYQNIGFLDLYDPDYVVILSGDHIYKMNYADMVDLHKKTGAACTISVLEVTMDEAKRFGIMNVDENDQIYEFEEKPPSPRATSPLWASTSFPGRSCAATLSMMRQIPSLPTTSGRTSSPTCSPQVRS